MQELRFVLIIVGALAIAALLFHGLWTSKKEGKAKFGDKPLGKLDNDSLDEAETIPNRSFAPEDDFEIIRKERKEPDFAVSPSATDPLIDSDPLTAPQVKEVHEDDIELNDLPSFSVEDPIKVESEPEELKEEKVIEPEVPSFELTDEQKENHAGFKEQYGSFEETSETVDEPLVPNETFTPGEPVVAKEVVTPQSAPVEEAKSDEELGLEVIVLNVHCAGEIPFVGTELFRSMENNGLTYGEMSIYHCFAQASDEPKVIFSVANMMQPGTLEHDDPADFTTKGISFFMTLPCYGQADQNFNVMLSAAQKIADDMGGNVLDESRNLMTPNRLSDYRKQIRDFMTASNA
ncbi:cell division protein ZipA [Vibrio sp. 10N.286.55.E10]|uniref:cell division protein ZipA n=1 Tax=unclassified Vibrio TaxID=2614977 RepID=UPI000C84F2E0|nr:MULTISPECIES: cell division protein ZipA [unclassified Vibrio]CAK3919487.1 Cell division protein ZipA [Vibrio crassostreae]PME28325.1 cell division protein ZipA [Vibrio sp. 10N.286.55.E12]PME36631.1 cell division protein ZipA [Vibrio sp. 10N.286.55.E10]PME69158.1 cell division protein ZipA [Vibrio sp. 10N.286.55.C11]TKE93127.1 cell division protein ZipA [Vibrio sp. F12]